MTENQRAKCHGIIHTASASAAAVGAGLAQIPGSDSAVIVPIQVTMTIALGQLFSLELSESSAKASVAAASASLIGRTLSQVLCGWIPLWGNILNATTAAGVTEAIGWALATDFSRQYGREQQVREIA